jgi:hypothetical protein
VRASEGPAAAAGRLTQCTDLCGTALESCLHEYTGLSTPYVAVYYTLPCTNGKHIPPGPRLHISSCQTCKKNSSQFTASMSITVHETHFWSLGHCHIKNSHTVAMIGTIDRVSDTLYNNLSIDVLISIYVLLGIDR